MTGLVSTLTGSIPTVREDVPRQKYELGQVRKSGPNTSWSYRIFDGPKEAENLLVINNGNRAYSWLLPRGVDRMLNSKGTPQPWPAKRLSDLDQDGMDRLSSGLKVLGEGRLQVHESSGRKIFGTLENGPSFELTRGRDGWSIYPKEQPKNISGTDFSTAIHALSSKRAEQLPGGTPATWADKALYPFYTPPGGNPLIGMGIMAGVGGLGGWLFDRQMKRKAESLGEEDETPTWKRMLIGAGIGAGLNYGSNKLFKYKMPNQVLPAAGTDPFFKADAPTLATGEGGYSRFGMPRPFAPNEHEKNDWIDVGLDQALRGTNHKGGSFEKTARPVQMPEVLFGMIMAGAPAAVLNARAAKNMEEAMVETPKVTMPQGRRLLDQMDLKDIPLLADAMGGGGAYAGPQTATMISDNSPIFKEKIEDWKKKTKDPRDVNEILSKGLILADPSYARHGVLAHEGGHAQIRNLPPGSPSRINQRFLRPMGAILGLGVPLVTSALAARLGMEIPNPGVRALLGAGIGAGLGGLAALPTLINERQATNRALGSLRGKIPDDQWRKEKRSLSKAYNTYLTGAFAAPALIGAMSGGYWGGILRD